jgi:hypothetical protein
MLALALIGFFNVIGTYSGGWLGGRLSKKYLLSGLYLGRSVVITAFLLAPVTPASRLPVLRAIGLLWLATVPLTNGLVAQIFGVRYLSMLGGFVFFSHQIGSFLGVWPLRVRWPFGLPPGSDGGGAARERSTGLRDPRNLPRARADARARWSPAAPAPGCRAARCRSGDGVLLSLAKLNRILAVDPVARTARVQPGVRNLAISRRRRRSDCITRRTPRARSPARSAATWPRTPAACTASSTA